jgi:hypothetical protein
LGSFAHHFQIKLSTHGSNLNSIFVIMSELEFFLLTGSSLNTLTPRSGEKFEPISPNPYLSIINRLFDEIIRLFFEFLLEI